MSAQTPQDDDEIISAINVTPLVDITLVLLIIFMVTATYIVAKSIPIDLPRASTGEDVTTTLALSLDREGKLYLEGRPATDDDVRRAIRVATGNNRDARAVISADQQVLHGRVVRLIDMIRREGVSRFAINIQPEEGSR